MDPNQLFITASRKKLRFQTTRGPLDVEALWELSLEDLDKIYGSLAEKLEKSGTKSLLKKRDTVSTQLNLAADIVKFIIETRLDEEEKAKARASKSGEKETLKVLLASKKLEELGKLSPEEIEAKIAALDKEG